MIKSFQRAFTELCNKEAKVSRHFSPELSPDLSKIFQKYVSISDQLLGEKWLQLCPSRKKTSDKSEPSSYRSIIFLLIAGNIFKVMINKVFQENNTISLLSLTVRCRLSWKTYIQSITRRQPGPNYWQSLPHKSLPSITDYSLSLQVSYSSTNENTFVIFEQEPLKLISTSLIVLRTSSANHSKTSFVLD